MIEYKKKECVISTNVAVLMVCNCCGKVSEIHDDFDEKDALRVKEIESVTNHDVKAVEYFIKEKLAGHKVLAKAAANL